jgi:hypothetical protein
LPFDEKDRAIESEIKQIGQTFDYATRQKWYFAQYRIASWGGVAVPAWVKSATVICPLTQERRSITRLMTI